MKRNKLIIKKNYKDICFFNKEYHLTHPVVSVSDEKLVINFFKAKSLDKMKDFLMFLYVAIFIDVLLLSVLLMISNSRQLEYNEDKMYFKWMLIVTIPVLLYLLKCLMVYLYSLRKKVILDRINGTITYPKNLFSVSFITIPFKELKILNYNFDNGAYDIPGESSHKNKMIKWNKANYMYWLFPNHNEEAILSNIVWYMDKNRPLPPGELFTSFRKKDYKRRKNEGFKTSLFKSDVSTPEYVYEYEKKQKESLKKPFIYLKDSFNIFHDFKFKNQHQIQCRNLIFDRDKGVILFQNSKSKGKIKGYYFNNLKFSSRSICLYNLKQGLHYLLYEEGMEYVFFRENLSAITWYMDKNRPLPPVPGFDRIRHQDYERRKEEGFPEPLYESRFPTPEAIPEQQEERECIGGW